MMWVFLERSKKKFLKDSLNSTPQYGKRRKGSGQNGKVQA
jgi:hypothetical protein